MTDIMKAQIALALAFFTSCMTLPAHITGKPSHDGDTAANKEADPTQKVSIEETETHRFIRSNGWPDHTPGKFPNWGREYGERSPPLSLAAFS